MGSGYFVKDLRRHLRQILGLDRKLRVAIMGAGNLGMALADYPGFRQEGFEIVALFDVLNEKVGHLSRGGVNIYDVRQLKKVVKTDRVSIAVIAVPVLAAETRRQAGGGCRRESDPQLLTGPADRAARREAEERRLDAVARELSFFLAREGADS